MKIGGLGGNSATQVTEGPTFDVKKLLKAYRAKEKQAGLGGSRATSRR